MSILFRKSKNDKRGKWSDVFRSLMLILFCYLLLRWITLEPYVIPSGSMLPTLFVQDYVLVKKWSYGLRIPFTEKWITGPHVPERGDVVVFKALDDKYHFMVKRVVGLPGDEVRMSEDGKLQINGLDLDYSSIPDENMLVFKENNGQTTYTVQFEQELIREEKSFNIPDDQIFLMGDNRDHSMDSRYWGTLPLNRVMGQVSVIWMSCKESEQHSSLLCPPDSIRWDRLQWVK